MLFSQILLFNADKAHLVYDFSYFVLVSVLGKLSQLEYVSLVQV